MFPDSRKRNMDKTVTNWIYVYFSTCQKFPTIVQDISRMKHVKTIAFEKVLVAVSVIYGLYKELVE